MLWMEHGPVLHGMRDDGKVKGPTLGYISFIRSSIRKLNGRQTSKFEGNKKEVKILALRIDEHTNIALFID